jgi:hypothetical protein
MWRFTVFIFPTPVCFEVVCRRLVCMQVSSSIFPVFLRLFVLQLCAGVWFVWRVPPVSVLFPTPVCSAAVCPYLVRMQVSSVSVLFSYSSLFCSCVPVSSLYGILLSLSALFCLDYLFRSCVSINLYAGFFQYLSCFATPVRSAAVCRYLVCMLGSSSLSLRHAQ